MQFVSQFWIDMDSYINLSMDILYVTIAAGQAIKGKIAP